MIEILADDEVFKSSEKPTATQAAGLAYERRVTNWLLRSSRFYPQIAFRVAGKTIIPDGLLTNGRDWVVVEIKNQEQQESYAQLGFYKKVIGAWIGKPIGALMICNLVGMAVKPHWVLTIPTLNSLYWSSFNLLPLGNRNLTLGADYGLGNNNAAASADLWSSGTSRNDGDSRLGVLGLESI